MKREFPAGVVRNSNYFFFPFLSIDSWPCSRDALSK